MGKKMKKNIYGHNYVWLDVNVVVFNVKTL